MLKTYFFFGLIILLNGSVFSQWEIAVAYYVKNETPASGFGVQFERKLPIQSPDIGASLRFEADFFNSTSSYSISGRELKILNLNRNYTLSVLAEFFLKTFHPYGGFGAGFGNFTSGSYTKTAFLGNVFAGIELNYYPEVIPFAEVQLVKYFTTFSDERLKEDISSFVIKGVIGLRFPLNVIN